MCIGSHQSEGRNTTFIIGHALFKKAILHLKRANGRFILQGTVPHFKGLISADLNSRAQGRDSIFNLRHALLKKAILLHKRPKV